MQVYVFALNWNCVVCLSGIEKTKIFYFEPKNKSEMNNHICSIAEMKPRSLLWINECIIIKNSGFLSFMTHLVGIGKTIATR